MGGERGGEEASEGSGPDEEDEEVLIGMEDEEVEGDSVGAFLSVVALVSS